MVGITDCRLDDINLPGSSAQTVIQRQFSIGLVLLDRVYHNFGPRRQVSRHTTQGIEIADQEMR